MRAIVAIGFAVLAAGALAPSSIPPAKSQPLDDQHATTTVVGRWVATTDCDRYVASGVEYEKINPDLAIPACESAVRKYPNSIHLIYQLGVAYKRKKDFSSALVQFRKAADQGDALAQVSLGMMYDKGQGVPQDYGEASKWYRKAAEQGNAHSQFALSRMYEAGLGVPQNYVQAHMWMNLAVLRFDADHGAEQRDDAIKHRNRLASLMGPAQVAEAHRLARICLQNDYKDCGIDRPRIARHDEAVPPPAKRWIARHDEGASPPAKREVASTGTGFFVSESGHIVTNAHVVEQCLTVQSSRVGQISKVSIDEQSDLALYIASEKPKAFARLRGGHGAKAGESVVAVGFPLSGLLSSDPIVTTGIISALSGLRNDRRTIQITAPIQPGSSGGPLLGENGSVVGVIVSTLGTMKIAEVIGKIPQNVNFAVSLGTLQSFLNANDVPYVLDDNSGTKSPVDITAEASRYTVLLECVR
jgi:hypothetical protein